MKRTGISDLPLHGGKAPPWLFKRMVKLAGGWLNYGLVSGHYLLVEGSVPGPKKRLIMLRKGIRAPEGRKEPVELRQIILESQQGV